MPEQTHCPDCGVHRDACPGIQTDASGTWRCAPCIVTAQVKERYAQVNLVIIPCPACSRTGMVAQCLVCNKLGSVKVPDSEIRVLSTAQMPQVLTEG